MFRNYLGPYVVLFCYSHLGPVFSQVPEWLALRFVNMHSIVVFVLIYDQL